MPQYRPQRPAGTPAGPPTPAPAPTPVTVGGWHYRVSSTAADDVAAVIDRTSDGWAAVEAAASATEVPVPVARDDIGTRGLTAAADDAGAPRSASSARRWAARDHIPDARTAELVQRRALVARRGGVQALADELGTTPATVSRWQAGRTDSMRGAAGKALDKVRKADARERSGFDPHGARIRVRGTIEHRAYGSTSDQYTGPREIDIDLDEYAANALAEALAAEDWATATAVAESAWSAWYTRPYADESGVHLLDVQEFDFEWH